MVYFKKGHLVVLLQEIGQCVLFGYSNYSKFQKFFSPVFTGDMGSIRGLKTGTGS